MIYARGSEFVRHLGLFCVGCLSGIMLVVIGLWAQRAQASFVQDCKSNAILRCGADTPTSLIAKIRANSPTDLQALYTAFRLDPASYDNFVDQARSGTVYRDGRIVVDGQVVATNATTIGRDQKSASRAYQVGAKTYYESSANTSLLNGSLPVMVYFDAHGNVQTAIISACGNPIRAKGVVPHFVCNLLQKAPVAGQANTYRFSTKASATNNASIAQMRYEFGDGSPAVTANLGESVVHTYALAGTFSAKVTAMVGLPGGRTAAATSLSCRQQIIIVAKLPGTGPEGWVGLFAGVTIASALLHVFASRR